MDGNTGNREDLARKEQTQPGIFPKSSFEDLLLLINGDSFTIVFANNNRVIIGFQSKEPDCADLPAVPDGIVQKIVKDLDNQWISEYF